MFACVPVLQNPDIVLVHYLNVPAVDDSGKPCGPVLCSINTDRKEWAKWSKEELIGQLKPMCELPLLSDSNVSAFTLLLPETRATAAGCGGTSQLFAKLQGG